MPSVVVSERDDSDDTATSASTTAAVYSGASKAKAARASGGENSAISNTQTQPAKNEPRAEMHNAGPARPARAIG